MPQRLFLQYHATLVSMMHVNVGVRHDQPLYTANQKEDRIRQPTTIRNPIFGFVVERKLCLHLCIIVYYTFFQILTQKVLQFEK